MNNLIALSRKLNRIKRFQMYKLFNEYTVAEHSYRVAILCYEIGYTSTVGVRNDAIKKALFHDLEEAILGDFPGPMKKLNPAFDEAYDALGDQVMESQLEEMEKYIWKNAKEGESGEIVKLADQLEAYQTVVEEVEAGNRSMIEVAGRFLEGRDKIFPKELLIKYPKANNILKDLTKRTKEIK